MSTFDVDRLGVLAHDGDADAARALLRLGLRTSNARLVDDAASAARAHGHLEIFVEAARARLGPTWQDLLVTSLVGTGHLSREQAIILTTVACEGPITTSRAFRAQALDDNLTLYGKHFVKTCVRAGWLRRRADRRLVIGPVCPSLPDLGDLLAKVGPAPTGSAREQAETLYLQASGEQTMPPVPCVGCGRLFRNLAAHLARSSSCPEAVAQQAPASAEATSDRRCGRCGSSRVTTRVETIYAEGFLIVECERCGACEALDEWVPWE